MALQLWQQAITGMSDLWWSTSSQTLHHPIPASCPHAQISCRNTSIVQDLCCFCAPGGQMLLTQFWDTHPSTGPEDAWTMHGLWPDKCDGSFETFCDAERHYSNISDILAADSGSLLSEMSTYWKDFKGQDPNLWAHEWNKHGTCISTLQPTCYPTYAAQTDVVDYFRTAMALFKTLPTYTWLADAGITPGREKRYSLSEIQHVLQSHHGRPVTIKCRYGQIDEIWYHFDVRGSVQTGDFLPTEPDGPKGNCPADGIRYLPKTSQHSSTTVTTPEPTARAPFKGRGYLTARTGGVNRGCLISSGQWYTSGSCATYKATQHGGGVVLASRKGPCAIVKSGAIKCAASIKSGQVFGHANEMLTYDGGHTFHADKIPHGFAKGNVYVDEQGRHETELELVWQSL